MRSQCRNTFLLRSTQTNSEWPMWVRIEMNAICGDKKGRECYLIRYSTPPKCEQCDSTEKSLTWMERLRHEWAMAPGMSKRGRNFVEKSCQPNICMQICTYRIQSETRAKRHGEHQCECHISVIADNLFDEQKVGNCWIGGIFEWRPIGWEKDEAINAWIPEIK